MKQKNKLVFLDIKRAFDVILSIFFICLFFLPFLIIAILIKIDSKGPLIYWSDRIGRYNRIFKMPKFRSMVENSPLIASHLLEYPDKFLTPVGRVLRKTSLDEIPQLWSILIGDMSFVGPRPALFNQFDLIELRTLKGLHYLTPGLTGWAQVNGRNAISWEKKFELDVWYTQNIGFFLDLKILFLTIKKIFVSEGINQAGSATMEAFKGS